MQSTNNKPRVCFLLEDFYPIIHGSSVQTLLLADQFVSLGLQVTVVTRQLLNQHARYENLKGVDVYRVKPAVGVNRFGKYLMLPNAFLALLRQRVNYDVIIVCDLKALGILGVIAARLLGKKCLLNAVSCGEIDGSFATMYGAPPSRLKTLLVKSLVSLRNPLLKKADGFISISSTITREFLNAGFPADAISEIHYGVNTEDFTPLDAQAKRLLRKELGLTDKRYFLYTGRLVEGKGLKYLLRVWKALVSEFQDIHLILVGAGQRYSLSCEDELRNFVRNNHIEHTVTFTGSVNNVSEYLQAGDFFIFPSQSEGLGLSLIEALSCGLPSIATSVGGILDIIEDNVNGLLVQYQDENQLRETMKLLLQNRTKSQSLANEARRTVLKKFSITRHAPQYLTLFEKLTVNERPQNYPQVRK